MPQAWFRFYAELNDFLPAERRFTEFAYDFLDVAAVKDRIESFGVPHVEVDLILVNGESAGFDYRVTDGDRISVYPVFEALDIAGVSRLRPEPLREPCFVLDTHLGKLAAFLRMTGFDTLYRNCFTDSELAAVSSTERRILLTRDVGLLKRGEVTHGYFVRETGPRRQLARLVRPFTRCMRCNHPLAAVSKDEVKPLLPPRTAEIYDEFQRCTRCRRVYWKGGHHRRMEALIQEVQTRAAEPSGSRA
jgi:uncharacterized protein with PIN domain